VHASHVSAGRQGSNGSTVATVVGSGSGSCATAVQLRILWHQEVFSKVRTLMVRQSRRATEQTMTQSRMARRGGDRTHHCEGHLVPVRQLDWGGSDGDCTGQGRREEAQGKREG